MTLGDLIQALEAADPNRLCPLGFRNPHSYRGYYDELAFEPRRDVLVSDMLSDARSAVGATYCGWKGGEYKMDLFTPVWLAVGGECGEAIGPILLAFILGEDPLRYIVETRFG